MARYLLAEVEAQEGQKEAPPENGKDTSSHKPFDPSFLLMIGLLVVVFYFLMIRPQQKQRREQQTMIGSLRRGDKVVTIGGIHGRIEGLKDKLVVLKVADNVKIEISKASIAQVVRRPDDEGGSEGGE